MATTVKKQDFETEYSVEIIALDTLFYQQGERKLSLFIERIKAENEPDKIHVDLASAEYWDQPENRVLTQEEKTNIAKDITDALNTNGIPSIVSTEQ